MNIYPFIDSIREAVKQKRLYDARFQSLVLADYLEEYGDIRAAKLRELRSDWTSIDEVLGCVGELCDCAVSLNISVKSFLHDLESQTVDRQSDRTLIIDTILQLEDNNIRAGNLLYLDPDGKIGKWKSSLGYAQIIGMAMEDYPKLNCDRCYGYQYMIKNEVMLEAV